MEVRTMEIRIKVGEVDLEAELLDNETARAIYDLLPIEGYNNVWGDEFYFEIPLYMPPDASSTQDVSVGDIAYWPPGKAMAIFFGATPLSKPDGKPVPAGPVNVIGRIKGDAGQLKKAKDSNPIYIEKI